MKAAFGLSGDLGYAANNIQLGCSNVSMADVTMARLLTALADSTSGNAALILQTLLGFAPEDYNDLLSALSESGCSYVDILAAFLHNTRVMAEDAAADPSAVSETLQRKISDMYHNLLAEMISKTLRFRAHSAAAPPALVQQPKSGLDLLTELLAAQTRPVPVQQAPASNADAVSLLQALLSSNSAVPSMHGMSAMGIEPFQALMSKPAIHRSASQHDVAQALSSLLAAQAPSLPQPQVSNAISALLQAALSAQENSRVVPATTPINNLNYLNNVELDSSSQLLRQMLAQKQQQQAAASLLASWGL